MISIIGIKFCCYTSRFACCYRRFQLTKDQSETRADSCSDAASTPKQVSLSTSSLEILEVPSSRFWDIAFKGNLECDEIGAVLGRSSNFFSFIFSSSRLFS